MQMGKGNEQFGKTALSYIYSIVAEMNIADWILENEDNFYTFWIPRTSLKGAALDYGHDNEDYAIKEYEKETGYTTSKVGFVERKDVPMFGDSPDRNVYLKDETGCVEVKCPFSPTEHIRYCTIKSDKDLLKIKPEYYWQCHYHIFANDASWCDFVSFDMYSKKTINIVRIQRNEEICNRINTRLKEARELALNILNQ